MSAFVWEKSYIAQAGLEHPINPRMTLHFPNSQRLASQVLPILATLRQFVSTLVLLILITQLRAFVQILYQGSEGVYYVVLGVLELTMYNRLASTSQRSTCFCLSQAGLKMCTTTLQFKVGISPLLQVRILCRNRWGCMFKKWWKLNVGKIGLFTHFLKPIKPSQSSLCQHTILSTSKECYLHNLCVPYTIYSVTGRQQNIYLSIIVPE